MRLTVLVVLACAFTGIAVAQMDLAPVQQGIEERAGKLEEIGVEVQASKPDFVALRDRVRELKRTAELQTGPIRQWRRQVQADLEKLGPVPSEGDAPETNEIAAERVRLTGEISKLSGVILQSDLNLSAADRMLQDIAAKRRDTFSRIVLLQGRSILNPQVWASAAETARQNASTFARVFNEWRAREAQSSNGMREAWILALAVIIAFGLIVPIRRRIDAAITARIEKLEPLRSRRILVAAARSAASFVPALVGGYLIFETLRSTGIISDQGEPIAMTIWIASILVMLVDGATFGLFLPPRREWRVVALPEDQFAALRLLMLGVAVVLGIDFVASRSGEYYATSTDWVLVQRGLVTIALAGLLIPICSAKRWIQTDTDDPSHGNSARRLLAVGRLLAIASIVATIVGYVNLGHYAMTGIFYLAGLFAAVWLLRSLLREGVRLLDAHFTSPQKTKAEDAKIVYFWIGTGIDTLAVSVFVPPALLILGAEWADLRDALTDLFFGFNVGSVRISVAEILAALGLFLGLLYATRLVQRTAETRLFPRSRIDVGVQNSLKTLIGYVGLIIAFTVAVGTLGFDLSNLAIIAGALSVGIGFGLQSIVNNFVSGLILLFERPIKVGDWIVTASGEGLVKRISVRSTEIETFDRSSVIIPNAELISSSVTNWTHKDKIGRVIVPVGVSYNADPETVIRLLKEVADNNASLLRHPEPVVHFLDFADSSLNFEVRAFIKDINSTLGVRTRLRVEIFNKLKESGVEIPFPQRDVHLIPSDGVGAEAPAP